MLNNATILAFVFCIPSATLPLQWWLLQDWPLTLSKVAKITAEKKPQTEVYLVFLVILLLHWLLVCTNTTVIQRL